MVVAVSRGRGDGRSRSVQQQQGLCGAGDGGLAALVLSFGERCAGWPGIGAGRQCDRLWGGGAGGGGGLVFSSEGGGGGGRGLGGGGNCDGGGGWGRGPTRSRMHAGILVGRACCPWTPSRRAAMAARARAAIGLSHARGA